MYKAFKNYFTRKANRPTTSAIVKRPTEEFVYDVEQGDIPLGTGAFKEAFKAVLKTKKRKYKNNYFSTKEKAKKFVIVNTKIPITIFYKNPRKNFEESNNLQEFLKELEIQKIYSDMNPPLAPKIYKISFNIFRDKIEKNSPPDILQQDLHFDDFMMNPFQYLNDENVFDFRKNTFFTRNFLNYDTIIFSLFEERCGDPIEKLNIPFNFNFFQKLELLVSNLVINLKSFFKDFKPPNTCPFYNETNTELVSLLALDLDPFFIDNLVDIQNNINSKLIDKTISIKEVEQICSSIMILQYLIFLNASSTLEQQRNIYNYLQTKNITPEYIQILISFFLFQLKENQSLNEFLSKNSFLHYFLPKNTNLYKNMIQKPIITLKDLEKLLYDLYANVIRSLFLFNVSTKQKINFYFSNIFLEKLENFNTQINLSLENKNKTISSTPDSTSWLETLGSFGRF